MDKRDKDLWHHVIKTVSPLKKSPNRYSKPLHSSPSHHNTTKKITSIPPKKEDFLHHLSPEKIQNTCKTLSYLEHGKTDNLDRRSAKRLLKGQMKRDDHIDLHGYTLDRAYHHLNHFIHASYNKGFRCVLVITGKGSGKLKRAVPLWLNDPHLRPMILSFCYARQNEGGSGALYVLIKRKRW